MIISLISVDMTININSLTDLKRRNGERNVIKLHFQTKLYVCICWCCIGSKILSFYKEKSNLWRKLLMSACRQVHRWGKPKQEPKEETETETMEECCLPACSSWLVSLAFLIQPKITCLGMALFTVGRILLCFKKVLHRQAHGATCWKQFPNWSFLFSG